MVRSKLRAMGKGGGVGIGAGVSAVGASVGGGYKSSTPE